MESRLIYKVSHSIYKIEWLNPTAENGAWIYIGIGGEMRKQFIISSINEYFSVDNVLYVSWTRNGSKVVLKENIENSIDNILGVGDFSVWDTNFKKVIEFNKTGVMRFGKVKKDIPALAYH